MPKENSYLISSVFRITYKLATIMYNPDSSNKVDSVDYKAVECTSLRVRARDKPSIRPSIKVVLR